MIERSYNIDDIPELIREFSKANPNTPSDYLYRLRLACREWAECFPEVNILSQTHTTAWVSSWQSITGHRHKTFITRFVNFNRWWRWLYEQRVIDSNILALLSPTDLTYGRYPTLTLPPRLQREMDTLLELLPWSKRTIDDMDYFFMAVCTHDCRAICR